MSAAEDQQPAARVAIRTKRTAGRAHLAAAHSSPFGRATACGRSLSTPEELPWERTAPQDRCARCARLAAGAS